MTKSPIHGFIKSRLAKDIGNCNVKRFTLLNIENIKKILSNKKNFELFLYTTPRKKFRSFSFNFSKNILLQKGSDLGEKIWFLKSIIRNKFILIGSDIPEINLKYILNAFEVLKNSDIVLGPTYDRGFWLIGFSNKKSINYPFKGIRWSTKYVLDDLTNNLKENGISTGFCQTLRDIDIFDDYCDYRDKV
tara:strand:- start:525 stop:1094 length:570 start_codon:yes stop_codon:yes gene_type:complete